MALLEDSTDLYQFLPLDREKKEIRLLQLEFVEGQNVDRYEIIKVKLVKASLNDPPNFNALSYTWGEHHCPQVILVSVIDDLTTTDNYECLIPVTENLYSALINLRTACASQETQRFVNAERRLSSMNTATFPGLKGPPDVIETSDLFWIDAICINQRDKAEKTWQVNMMHEIYTSASQVTAWLGEPGHDDLTYLLNALMKCLVSAYRLFGRSVIYPPSVHYSEGVDVSALFDGGFKKWLTSNIRIHDCCTHNGWERENGESSVEPGVFGFSRKSLEVLDRLPDWSRAWTLEEVVLGRRVIFYYGLHTYHSLEIYHALSLCGQAIGLSEQDRVSLNKPTQVYNRSALSLMWKYEDSTFSRALPELIYRMNGRDRSVAVRAYKAEDYVFSLLGMLVPGYTGVCLDVLGNSKYDYCACYRRCRIYEVSITHMVSTAMMQLLSVSAVVVMIAVVCLEMRKQAPWETCCEVFRI
jgi:hypothetical protein